MIYNEAYSNSPSDIMVTLKDQNQATIYSGNSTNGAGVNTLALNLGTFTNPLTLEITNNNNNQTFEIDNITLTQDGIEGVSYYTAQLVSAQDYYPFGTTLPGRTFQDDRFSGYRFTFNGKEDEKETQTQDYGMRIYDSRLGRFLSVDPLAKEFIDLAPYQFTENSPIANVDLDGLERYYTANGILIGTIGNSTEIRITNSKNTSSVAYWVNAANNPPKNTDANFATRAAKYANTMSVPTFVIPTAKLETQPKTTSSSGNGKPWYDLEGSDNGGNDRVAPG